ncbi:MAG: DUF4177 domain-containing protein [Myxococcales bacterium]|nr:DUF4177 domain-containing protein [Myxococcales bacterium]
MQTEFRYVETSTVTDEEMTRLVNEYTSAGWQYDGVHFAMRDASKRPAMAFLLFTRPKPEEKKGEAAT